MEISANYLDKFQVHLPQTLFPPDITLPIHQKVCPLCFNKLKFPRGKPIAYCDGVKHAKRFVIRLSTLNK